MVFLPLDFNNMGFDETVNRRGSNSIKWDTSDDPQVLPMWIADMDFKSPSSIAVALTDRAKHGVYGYTKIPDAFYDAIVGWWKNYHELDVERELILPATGVMPGITAVIRSCLKPGQRVIVQPPVYNRFFEAVQNCGCTVVENSLLNLDEGYSIDFDDLEIKASDPETKMLLLCNPHNPVGRSWREEELERLAMICSKHNLIIVSDEAHCDLAYEGHKHVPFASIASKYSVSCFTCGSPGKTFNLSGLQVAYLFCPDKKMRSTLEKQLEGAKELNAFAVEGLIAAYADNNYEWLRDLKVYFIENYSYLKEFCETRLHKVKVTKLEATYLVWLDCRAFGKTSRELHSHFLKNEKLWVVPGHIYGSAGEGFLRINIASSRSIVEEGLLRLERGLQSKSK
jgi:cysteine-S-conjugate beta-lyase